jgi:hypothetical protein
LESARTLAKPGLLNHWKRLSSNQPNLNRFPSPKGSYSMNKKPFLSRRWQMAFVGVGLWFLLLLWSASAFWQHIDALKPTYQLASKCGALAGEFALLAMVIWHCFDKHIGVRRWSLILGFILAGVILVHAGALRGMHDAETSQTKTVDQLTNKLGELSKQQIETGSKAAGQIRAV